MDRKRFTLLISSETHRKLKILSSETGQSMTKILVDCIDEKYVEFERTNQSLLSQEERKFFYSR